MFYRYINILTFLWLKKNRIIIIKKIRDFCVWRHIRRIRYSRKNLSFYIINITIDFSAWKDIVIRFSTFFEIREYFSSPFQYFFVEWTHFFHKVLVFGRLENFFSVKIFDLWKILRNNAFGYYQKKRYFFNSYC